MAIFLVDAQLPPDIAVRLRAAGHAARHVGEIGLGDAKDREIARAAEDVGAILMTKDEDFVSMLAARRFKGPLLWVRIGNTSNRHLWFVIENRLETICNAFADGEKLIELRD